MTSTETLITKVANAAQGHDSLGPTGLVVHLTPAERDEIIASLARTTTIDEAQVDAYARTIARPVRGCATDEQYQEVVDRASGALRAALTAAAQAGEPGKWFKRSLACEEFVIDNVVHGEITRGIEQTWCAMFHHRCVGRGFEDICDARAAVTQASGAAPTPPASGEDVQVCGACGQPWTGEPCGQKDNGHPFPTCYPAEDTRIASLSQALAEARAECASKSDQIGKLYVVCNERDILKNELAEAEKRTEGKVLLPRHLTPAMACALAGALPPPWPNGDPHNEIPQLVQNWQQKWANAIAAATKG